ncbi:MAG: hypothetical protein AAFU64_08435 [Bacteroidota bacterium]
MTDKTEDVREGDEYVYGESADAPARQSELEYADPPEAEKRAQDIRKKMFDGPKTSTPAPATAPADSSQNVAPADTVVAEEGQEI